MENEELMKILNQTLFLIDEKYNEIAKSFHLTFNMLMYIYTVENSDSITQKDICDALLLQKSSVKSITDKFIKDSYINLCAGKNKKEKIIVKTAEGNEFFKMVFDNVRKMEAEEISKLNVSDKEKLISICRKVTL